MADVLSQSQIDALFNSMMSGSDSGGEVAAESNEQVATPAVAQAAPSVAMPVAEEQSNWRNYDFSSPKKFTKDKLKQLKSIYDNYARLVSLRLNGILRMVCEAEIISLEEQRFFEFYNMINDTDVMMIMNAMVPGDENKEHPVLFHVSQKLMVGMMDRMLGGSGEEEIDIDLQYEYTELELVLYKKAMESILGATNSAWVNYAEFEIGESYVDENPALFQDISMDESVVIVLMNVKINNADGIITVCIPGTLLMDVFTLMEKKKYTDGLGDKNMQTRDNIMQSINKSTMEIRAELGGASVNLEDIFRLNVGDVIDLNKPKDAEITLFVEGQPWFAGQLGVYNKNTAIQISKRLDEEAETKQSE